MTMTYPSISYLKKLLKLADEHGLTELSVNTYGEIKLARAPVSVQLQPSYPAVSEPELAPSRYTSTSDENDEDTEHPPTSPEELERRISNMDESY